jgi:hypothetical protein
MKSSSRILLGAVALFAWSIGCSPAKNANAGGAGTPGGSGPSGSSSGNGGSDAMSGNGGMGGPAASGNGGQGGSSTGAGGMSSPSKANGTGGGAAATPPPAAVAKMLDPKVDWTALKLVYSPMYSAYDGKHTFQVPVHVDGATVDISGWQAIPASAVSFDPDPDVMGGVLVTVLDGTAEITIAASNGMVGGTAPLRITTGTPAQWEAGKARYNNGVEFTLMVDFSQVIDPNWMPPPPPPNLACNNCHSTGAKYFEIQHTPTQAARFSDDDLSTIFTKGMKPPGVGFRVLPDMIGNMKAVDLYAMFHKWDASADEIKGLIIYLRSLTPKGQGDILLPDGTYAKPGTLPPGAPGSAGASGSAGSH